MIEEQARKELWERLTDYTGSSREAEHDKPPALMKEVLAYRREKAIFWAILAAVVAIPSIVLSILACKGSIFDAKGALDLGALLLAALPFALTLSAIWIILHCIDVMMKLRFAPKLFLIQVFKRIIGE